MSITAAKASLDQVSALVRGVQLPLEAIDQDHLEIVVAGLADAFEDARAAAPVIVATGNEAAVTALIESHLNRRIDEDPIWRSLVARVGRGTESINYDGTKIEKRPDLSISFTARSRRFPLIVEAKIIDLKSSKTAKLYCENGVHRFQIGDYAWGCREAVMLAYVRDGSNIAATLTPQITRANGSGLAEFGTTTGLTVLQFTTKELASSEHDRSFLYPSQRPPRDKPGPISLWHVWLR
ncbi:hypothetical protein [Loktanella salsilacus]|uniref:hypothetical protein n=1 Tax=Loktanella salsilacus TaxID=195913 RepID=UPI003736D8A7